MIDNSEFLDIQEVFWCYELLNLKKGFLSKKTYSAIEILNYLEPRYSGGKVYRFFKKITCCLVNDGNKQYFIDDDKLIEFLESSICHKIILKNGKIKLITWRKFIANLGIKLPSKWIDIYDDEEDLTSVD